MAIYRYNFIAKIIKNPEKSTEHRSILDICQAPTCSMASSVKGCQYRIPTYTSVFMATKSTLLYDSWLRNPHC